MLTRALLLVFALVWIAPGASAAPETGKRLTVTTTSPEAEQAFLRGRDFYENRSLSRAAEEFKRALALDPKFPSALSYLGIQIGGPEGLALARRAVANSAGLPEPERLLLRSHLEQLEGKGKEARTTLREASRLAPDDWHLLYYVGRLAGIDRLSGLAIMSLKRAVQINPNAAPVWNPLGYMLANQGDLEGAIEALKTYERLLPKDPNPPDSLAEIYLRAGRLEEAEKAYGRSVERAADATHAYLGVAEVRFLRGDYRGGQQAAEKARAVAGLFREKQQAERLAAWGFMAEGRPADAFKTIQDAEARAKKQGAFYEASLAAVNEARMKLEAGDAAGAFARAREVEGAQNLSRLAGDQAATVKLRAQTAVLLAALQLHRDEEAQRAAAEIQRLHAQLSENNELLMATHFAKGMLALGKDPRLAVAELTRCEAEDAYCAWKLLDARQAAGEQDQAAKARRELSQRSTVEQVYLDADPFLIFVHAKLVSGSAH